MDIARQVAKPWPSVGKRYQHAGDNDDYAKIYEYPAQTSQTAYLKSNG
jgi:hypothetical protein